MTIEEKKLKSEILKILQHLGNFYTKLNQELLFGWRKFLSKQSDNRVTAALKVLIENRATALFLNTLLFAAVGQFFGGLIGQIFFIITGLNIVLFCATILGWEDKLKK